MSTLSHNFSHYPLSDARRRTPLSIVLFETVAYSLVALILFFSEFRTKPTGFEKINMQAVASRLVPSEQVLPYRAPLRLVRIRKPVIVAKTSNPYGWPNAVELWEHIEAFPATYCGVYMQETLECGHKLSVYPGDAEPLIARRRRCHECLDTEVLNLPRKKPMGVVSFGRTLPDRRRKAA